MIAFRENLFPHLFPQTQTSWGIYYWGIHFALVDLVFEIIEIMNLLAIFACISVIIPGIFVGNLVPLTSLRISTKKMRGFVQFLLAAALFAVCKAATVIKLTDQNFDEVVNGDSNVLVEFYAEWCGHCKNLEPEYASAAASFAPADGVILAAIDASTYAELGTKYNVEGFPTIKWFPKGSTEPVDYDGGRTADTIVQWLNGKLGTTKKVKSVPSAVATLTTDNFESMALGKKAAMVYFYAPWCGHCKQLAPVWERLAQAYAGDSKTVVIGKVDATQEVDLASKYEIQGYPTLKFFPADSAESEGSYDGERDLEAMVTYINEKTGLQRTADGGLLPMAGRVATLDELIKSVTTFNKVFADSVKKTVDQLAGADLVHGKQYIATANKIVEKGIEYVDKEIQRLDKLIGGASISAEKKTGFLLKQNVLKAFLKA